MSNNFATTKSMSAAVSKAGSAPVIAYWSGDLKAEARACGMAASSGAQLFPLDTRVPYNLPGRLNRSRVNFEVTAGWNPELDAATSARAERVLASGREVVAMSSDFQGGIAPAVSTLLSLAGEDGNVRLVA
ncbi:hypothetical protein [Paratractidigestivibacter sp.]|uniref:hypothetical protein n=1 Tax=Paratractidigestivibacter sp. TaxID=2847316 RepID=UPI002ABE9376|nr:hypothetical protein [Paratractidigestivibacter sp.]